MATMSRWTQRKERYAALVAEYGAVAVSLHLTIFFSLLIGSACVIQTGLGPETAAGHLGAVGGGDLGEHFPSSDPQWRDVNSRAFVDKALEIVREAGFRLVNCDLTIVGERPRIALHRKALRFSLAGVLGVDVSAVSVKATTTDGLGFTGRGEGVGALVVVLVEEVEQRG